MTELQSGFLGYRDNKMHVLRFGSGKKVMLAFHGFHNDARLFIPVFEPVLKDYTVLSVDLPGHGATEWHDTQLSEEALVNIMQRIRTDFKVDKIAVAGYSLGGRLALMTVVLKPAWVDRLLLFAPDGLRPNFWFGFSTHNLIGKYLFNKIVRNPDLLLKRMDLFEKYHLVNKSVLKLAKNHLENMDTRRQLGIIWPATSHLIPDPVYTRRMIVRNHIPVCIITGKYDRLIPSGNAVRFGRGIPGIHMHILETGHQVFNREALSIAADFLLNKENC